MAYYKKTVKKTYRRRGKRAARGRRKGGKRGIKKMIRREIARNVENKTVQSYVYARTLVSSGTYPDMFAYDSVADIGNQVVLGPNINGGPGTMPIAQGVGQGDRVGNQIKTKRLMFKGTLVAAPQDPIYNPYPAPVQVKMFIYYDKTTPVSPPYPVTDFFQNGNGAKAFANDLVDMWSPINTDRYRVLTTRTFKLGYAGNTGTGAEPSYSHYANNDFKYNQNFSINLTKYYPKTVRFSDAAGTPRTRGLYCLFAYVCANGNQLPVNIRSVRAQWMQTYTYEDA